MAYPDKPAAAFDYSGFQGAKPTTPLPGDQLDADLQHLKDSADQTVEFLKVLATSEGKLKPGALPTPYDVVTGAEAAAAEAAASAAAADASADASAASAAESADSVVEAQAAASAAAAGATASAASATEASNFATDSSTSAGESATSASAAALSAAAAAASAEDAVINASVGLSFQTLAAMNDPAVTSVVTANQTAYNSETESYYEWDDVEEEWVLSRIAENPRISAIEDLVYAPQSVQTIGITTTPANGDTNQTANTFALANPVLADGYINAIRAYAGSSGAIAIRIFEKSGDDFTQAGSDYTINLAAGLNTLSYEDFVHIPVETGQYIGFYFSTAGRVRSQSGTITDHHWFSVTGTGNSSSFTDTTASTVNALQISFDVAFNDIPDRVDTLETGYEALKAAVSVTETQVIGCPDPPVNASQGSGGTYVFIDAVENDGMITAISLYSEASTTVPVHVWRDVGNNNYIKVSSRTLTVAAGLNELSSDDGDFTAFAVKAGQHLGYYSDGNVNYITPSDAYGSGYRRTTANVSYIDGAATTATTGTAKLQIGFYVDYDAPVAADPADEPLPLATDGATLHRFKAKAAVLEKAGTGIIKIGFGIASDSWADWGVIPEALKGILDDAYGLSGYGWIAVDSVDGGLFQMTGLTHVHSNWTLYDASSDGAPNATIGCALDGKVISTTGTTATASITVQCQTFRIAYFDGDGAFRYRVDGGSWITVTGAGTDGKAWKDITGLTDASHTVEIDTTVNNGNTVAIYGYMARRTAPGIELSKIGNGSIDGEMIETYLDQMPFFLDELDFDLFIIILGTNDYRRGKPFVSYTNAITGAIEAARDAVADCGVILWGPADTNGSAARPLTDYVEEMHRLSGTLGVEFFNHNKLFGTWSQMNTLGMFEDTLHMNEDGAYCTTKELARQFLWS